MKLPGLLLLCLVLISSWFMANTEAQGLLSNVLGTVFATSSPPPQTHAPMITSSPPATIDVPPVASPRTEVPSPAPVDANLLPLAPLSPETRPVLPATLPPPPVEQPSPSPPAATLPVVTIPATLSPPSRAPQSPPPTYTTSAPPPSSPLPTRTPVPTPPLSLPSSPPTPTAQAGPTPAPTPPSKNVPVAPTRNPSVPITTTATPTTTVPLAPTRLPTGIASNSATVQPPRKPEVVQLAPKRIPIILKHNATTTINNASQQEKRLAPTRMRTSATAVTPAVEIAKCSERESNRMNQYYLKNKQLRDNCTRAANGYKFPFSGAPSRDQIRSTSRSNACVLLLKGISQVLTTDCVLGDVPVRRTAATILLSAGESSHVTHEASESGSLMGSAQIPSKSVAKESVKLSTDLEIVSGWQNAPVRGESAAVVHGDVAISTELQTDTNATTTMAFAPSVNGQAKTKEAIENIAAHTLTDSATSAVPPSMRRMSLCLGTLVLGNTLVLLL